MDLTSILGKLANYKNLVFDNLEAFILVFLLGWVLAWLFSRGRIETANSRAEFQKERAEHYRDRLDALDKQQLKTSTPPSLEKRE